MTDTLIQRLSDEADLCRNDGATDVAKLLDDAVYALVNQAARLAAAEIVSAQPAAPAEPKGADGLPVSAPRLYADEEPPGHADHVSKARDLFDAAPSVAPEPVAWRYQDARGHYRYRAYKPGFDVEYAILKPVPLYAAHPPRAPLTSAEIDKAISTSRDALLDHIFEHGTTAEGIASRFREVARAVEAAHGIRGQG